MAQKFTPAQLATLRVLFAEAGAGMVPGAWLEDGAVTTIKLADNSVTTAKIVNQNITYAKLDLAIVADIASGVVAYGWGNHALVGYLTAETDPSFTASPAHGITAGSISNWNTAYGWGNHASAGYLTVGSTPKFVRNHQTGVVGVTLTLPTTPTVGSNVQVFKNAALLREGVADDFTISGAVITFAVGLIAGDRVDTFYMS